jgi:hypothetical protein
MVRWLVASAYGDSMRGFASEQHGATRPWADVATFGRAGRGAAGAERGCGCPCGPCAPLPPR